MGVIRSNSQEQILLYLDCILDVLADGIYISDHTGKTLKVNNNYEHLTGLYKEELVGKDVTDLVSEGKFDQVLNPEIVKTGKPKSLVQITKKGRRVILDGYPVFDKAGKVALVVTFVRDITLLSQLKEQIAYQQEMITRCNEVNFEKKNRPNTVVIRSQVMRKLIDMLAVYAKTDVTVMLLGETGVGKDVLARKIHAMSARCEQPFFKIDCTTLPENLVESELFGYVSGAFSGASNKGKPGYFEMANNGTLFLDEIGELPLFMQAKLLRVLQDQEFMRIGSTKTQKLNVRFIAATNRDLEAAVKNGTFRSDLFFRLQVAMLKIPSLRERREDIEPLADYFLEIFNTKYKKEVSLSAEVRTALQNYNWPGNIREMENLLQSLVIVNSRNTVELFDLPKYMLSAATVVDSAKALDEIVCEVEKDIIKKALEEHRSIKEVAKQLKVDRTTIFRKMRKYGLSEK